MNTAYIILGGNIGNRSENLRQARQFIEAEAGTISKASEIFATAAWGNIHQPDFYNQALCIHTMLGPQQLLKTLLDIEKKMGRIRGEQKWTARTIDIDILFYNDAVISEPQLSIPHPYIQERRFVLRPLAQIAGTFVHPVLHQTVNELLSRCPDSSDVQLLQ